MAEWRWLWCSESEGGAEGENEDREANELLQGHQRVW